MAKKILVLDDNPDILEIVEAALSYEHFEVKGKDKSVDLIRVALAWRPDLILLDFRLADGNGGDLCKALKSHAQLQHVPVIIFSAYMHKNLDFSEFGCDAVISKPFDLDLLVNTVNGLIGTA